MKATARYPLGCSRTMWDLLLGLGMDTGSALPHERPASSEVAWPRREISETTRGARSGLVPVDHARHREATRALFFET